MSYANLRTMSPQRYATKGPRFVLAPRTQFQSHPRSPNLVTFQFCNPTDVSFSNVSLDDAPFNTFWKKVTYFSMKTVRS